MYTEKYVDILQQRRTQLALELEQALQGRKTFLWEVGCGHGHFLTAYAAAHPERLCIGIDLIGERIERAERKRDRAQLSNLHFLQAEARLFLETLPGEVAIEGMFILFPDPWPKLRHQKHRILQASFLDQAAARCAPGAPLYFRTDFQPYYASAREALAEHSRWTLSDEAWPFEFATVFQQRAETHYSAIARCKLPI